MNIGPLNLAGSLAGAPLAQIKGTDTERTQRQAADQARETDAAQRAESAAGIGQTEEESQAQERDADGRRLWERTAHSPAGSADEESAGESARPKDPSGERGGLLDISG